MLRAGEAEPERTTSTPTTASAVGPGAGSHRDAVAGDHVHRSPATASPSLSPHHCSPRTDGPREATLSIPALGLSGLRVVPYVGTPDDGPGTVIQDDGSAAAPHGSGGLVGPGGIGNYLVTGHRSSSTAPFRYLPSLRVGARIVVVDRRPTGWSTRSWGHGVRRSGPSASLREQSAAVPGRPGLTPTRAMITLSTCATFEDHAAGNYWSDEFHNPEHRIEKIGVLRSVRPRLRRQSGCTNSTDARMPASSSRASCGGEPTSLATTTYVSPSTSTT